MRCSLWLGVVCAVPLALAQDPEPVFRTGTRLVQVDVVVQSKGKNVKQLTKDDFELYDNGKLQSIAIFTQRSVVPPDAPPRKLLPGLVTNRPMQTGTEPVSATVILIDSQNTEVADQIYARQEAMKYIQGSNRRESIAIYQLDTSLKLVQPFTEDRDALYRALDIFHGAQSVNLVDTGATGNAAAAVEQVSQQRRADITSALGSLALNLKYIPGRKKLLWMTAALPLTLSQTTRRNGVEVHDYTDMSQKVLGPIGALNDANVAVYPIDPRGGSIFLPPKVGFFDPNLTTMIRFAERTGGIPLYGTNDIAGSIELAIADTDVTYTLGFYPREEKYDGAEHQLRVHMKRGGAEVRYRNSYRDETKPPVLTKASREATVNAWMQEPLDATAIPLAAYATPVPNRPGYVEVRIKIDPGSLKFEHANGRFNGSIQLAIAPDIPAKAKGLRQTIAFHLTDASYVKALAEGMVLTHQVLANPAKKEGPLPKQMHVVVLDETTGNAGSVRVPITAAP
jgi:VWFA-related protein